MFLHVSVILFVGVGGFSVPACTTGHMTSRCGSLSRGSLSQGLCPGGSLSRGVSVQEDLCLGVSIQGVSVQRGSLSRGSLYRGVSVQGVSVVGGFCHTVMCGQYASYWNAFLFWYCFVQNS